MSKVTYHLHVGVMPDDRKEVRKEIETLTVHMTDTMIYIEDSWTDWGEQRKDGEAWHVVVSSTWFVGLISVGNVLFDTGKLVPEPMDDAGYWFLTTAADWSEVLVRGANDGDGPLEIRPGAWG